MKCDLHVHSYFSGMCTTPLLRRFCRESYSPPEEVYSLLERRNMNLFTLTDHDSIEGAEQLRQHADFFLSEELTCQMPSGSIVHLGVYDLTDRQHVELQRRRNDLVALLTYLREHGLLSSVNHVFSSLTGPRDPADFDWFRDYFPAMESHNSHMLAEQNLWSTELAKKWNKIALAGSDAHALPSVGMAYTEVPGARNKEEFFAGLRMGRGRVHGESGSFRKLTRDVFLIATEMMREKNWTRTLAPLAVLVPAVTYWNYCCERSFGRRWAASVLGRPGHGQRRAWISLPEPAAGDSL